MRNYQHSGLREPINFIVKEHEWDRWERLREKAKEYLLLSDNEFNNIKALRDKGNYIAHLPSRIMEGVAKDEDKVVLRSHYKVRSNIDSEYTLIETYKAIFNIVTAYYQSPKTQSDKIYCPD